MYENENYTEKPSAPTEGSDMNFIPFKQNLYPKISLPEFDTNNYRINRIMNNYKFLDEERKSRESLKKKYAKVSTTFIGTECLITVSELGMIGASIALPIMIPFSVPISAGLTACSTILRSTSGIITRKINKHSEIELLAKSKLNSIEEKFTKAIKDGQISDEEFNDIEQEVKNYNNMKLNILSEYNKGKKQPKEITDDIKIKLLEKGKVLGRTEVWDSLKKEYKI